MNKFESTFAALDQQAEMLAAARDKGAQAVDEALDKLAEKLAISLANNPNITPARRDEAFDELFTYVANRAGIQIDP